MSVLNVMKHRCSVRAYEKRAVERDKILAVLGAARIAPSACNRQPWRFVVVIDEEQRRRIDARWAERAPVFIVAVGDHSLAWHRQDGKDHCDIDVAIAVDHMTLEAQEQGLGTCWVCAFDAARCRRVLELAEHEEAVVLLPIGYPAERSDPERHVTARKALDDLVTWVE